MIKVNSWNEYDTLKTVILGNVYDIDRVPKIYEGQDQDSFQKIVEQTHTELKNIQTILEQNGVRVLRPTHPVSYEQSDFGAALINMRDFHMAYGNMFFMTYGSLYIRRHQHAWLEDIVSELVLSDNLVLSSNEPNIEKVEWGNISISERWMKSYHGIFKNKNLLHTASILKHNKIAYISQSPGTYVGKKWIQKWLEQQDIQLRTIKGFGHIDGGNSILNHDTILTTKGSKWEDFKNVIVIPSISIPDPNPEIKAKIKNPTGWLYEMQGHYQKFNVSINALSINPHLVMLSFYDKDFYEVLRNHGVKAIYVEWKNHHWWSGGLHCITCDVERQTP